ncbi:MAG: hypothetical protein LBQ76_08230 [Candidatus Fibromonas sp.]|jgi:hypothetical protein|nr:hypothetical protein [Candidatus Fibromonas sp.]
MNKLHVAIFCFALALLASCGDNLFGSSSAGSCGKDIKCLRLEAENEFRSGNYEKSYNIYKDIAGIDSTASVGYFGMAQAGLWMRGINPFDIFRFTDLDKIEDGKIPFRGDSIKVQNRYYQGMTLAYNALSELNRRDSLTNLYELHKKESLGQAGYISDTLMEDLTSFRNEFSPFKGFPLSDREYKPNAYRGGLLISTTIKAMLSVFDINNDGCITKSPRNGKLGDDYPGDPLEVAKWEGKEWSCDCKPNNIYSIKNKCRGYDYDQSLALNPDGTIDAEQVLDELNEELEDFYQKQLNSTDTTELPPKIGDINDKISDFKDNMDELVGMLGEGDWQSEISKYNDYASFYKVGTRLDEDGDGCFDEELLNKLDNDGDGLTGEDARLASLDQGPFWGKMGANHVFMYNEDSNDPRNLPMILPQDAKKYICNEPAPDCPDKRTNLRRNEEGDITVIGFTQEPGYWTTDSLELKLEVAQDTECGNLKYGLEKRKNLVGGCWLFYDEEQFKRIWLNRHANNCCVTNPNCAAEKVHVLQTKK